METKVKRWFWKLTYPFAHRNYTVLFGTVYFPKGKPPNDRIMAHEAVHCRQAEAAGGWWKFYWKYLFCFPFRYNKHRWNWEMEAYVYGSGIPEEFVKPHLNQAMYGWLKEPKS